MKGNREANRPGHAHPPSRRRVDALILGVLFLLALTLCLLPTPSSVPSADPAASSETAADRSSRALPKWPPDSSTSSSPEALGLGRGGLQNWTATTDEAMGGTSEVELQVVDGTLRLEGELGEGSAFPWAGGTVAVGETLRSVQDISRHHTLRFRLRGEPRQVAVMVISGSSRHMPPTQFVMAEAQWTEIVLPLDGFLGADLQSVQGFAFSAVQTPGSFSFEIDDVELH